MPYDFDVYVAVTTTYVLRRRVSHDGTIGESIAMSNVRRLEPTAVRLDGTPVAGSSTMQVLRAAHRSPEPVPEPPADVELGYQPPDELVPATLDTADLDDGADLRYICALCGGALGDVEGETDEPYHLDGLPDDGHAPERARPLS